MIQGVIVKKVLDLVLKQLLKQFKLDKVLDYVEKPNDLDKQMAVLQRKVDKYGKYIEEMEKDIAKIKSVAHTPINGLSGRLDKLEKKARF
tara:strand:+ start:1934 stop:2203 length:270 start_codon:yes stop_codon:yes gene_type:complete